MLVGEHHDVFSVRVSQNNPIIQRCICSDQLTIGEVEGGGDGRGAAMEDGKDAGGADTEWGADMSAAYLSTFFKMTKVRNNIIFIEIHNQDTFSLSVGSLHSPVSQLLLQ